MVIRCTRNKGSEPTRSIDLPRRHHHLRAPNVGWGAGTKPPPRSLTLITVLFFVMNGWASLFIALAARRAAQA